MLERAPTSLEFDLVPADATATEVGFVDFDIAAELAKLIHLVAVDHPAKQPIVTVDGVAVEPQ